MADVAEDYGDGRNTMAELYGLTGLSLVADSTERLLAAVRSLTDEQARALSGIPPWTRGHVVTHVARAADSYRRLLAGAISGVPQPQYPSMEYRAEQIESGSGRPVHELAEDLAASSARFETAMRELPVRAWNVQVRMRPGELRLPAALPAIRVRELEVHHVDLMLGYRFTDIAPTVATWIIDDILMELNRRDPLPMFRLKAVDTGLTRQVGAGDSPLLTGTQSDLLAWLSGRTTNEGIRVAGSGQVPPAPYWI